MDNKELDEKELELEFDNKELNKNIELEGFEYIKEDDVINIPVGTRIFYILKDNFFTEKNKKKSGILVSIQNPEILKLRGGFNAKWYIYTNKYYIFYKKKIEKKNPLKEILTKLVEEDFKSITSIQHENYQSSSTSTSEPSFSES
jgi:hypothetical protein